MTTEKIYQLLLAILLIISIITLIGSILYYNSPNTEQIAIRQYIGLPPTYTGCRVGNTILNSIFSYSVENGEIKTRLTELNQIPTIYLLTSTNASLANFFGADIGTTNSLLYPSSNTNIGNEFPCLVTNAIAWAVINNTICTLELSFPFISMTGSNTNATQTIKIPPFNYTYINDPNLNQNDSSDYFFPMYVFQPISYTFFNPHTGKKMQSGTLPSPNSIESTFNPATDYFIVEFNIQNKKINMQPTVCNNVGLIQDIPTYVPDSTIYPIPTPIELAYFYPNLYNLNNSLPGSQKTWQINGTTVNGYISGNTNNIEELNLLSAVPWVLNLELTQPANVGLTSSEIPVFTLEAEYVSNGNNISIILAVVNGLCPSPVLYQRYDDSSCGNPWDVGGTFNFNYACLTCSGNNDPCNSTNYTPGYSLIKDDRCAEQDNISACGIDYLGKYIKNTYVPWTHSHLSMSSFMFNNQIVDNNNNPFAQWNGGLNNTISPDTPTPLYIGQNFKIGKYVYSSDNSTIMKSYITPNNQNSPTYIVPTNTITTTGILDITITYGGTSSGNSIASLSISNKKIVPIANNVSLPINLSFLGSTYFNNKYLKSNFQNNLYFYTMIGTIPMPFVGSGITVGNSSNCTLGAAPGGCNGCYSFTPASGYSCSSDTGQSVPFSSSLTIYENNTPIYFTNMPNYGNTNANMPLIKWGSVYTANYSIKTINGQNNYNVQLPFLIGNTYVYELTINWDTITWIGNITTEDGMTQLIQQLMNYPIYTLLVKLTGTARNSAGIGTTRYTLHNDPYNTCVKGGNTNRSNCDSSTSSEYIRELYLEITGIGSNNKPDTCPPGQYLNNNYEWNSTNNSYSLTQTCNNPSDFKNSAVC